MKSGYDQIYLDLLPRLQQCDLAECAPRLGLPLLANGSMVVKFCGREFSVTSSGVTPTDGLPVDVNYRSVLAYYTLSKGQGEPEQSYVPLTRLSGSLDGQKTLAKNLFVGRLLAEFGSDYEKVQAAAHQLDGVPEGTSADGGRCWRFLVLPKISIRLVFYLADDEFPSDLQLLFDRSATRFLEFECLAFLSGCFTKALLAAAKNVAAARL